MNPPLPARLLRTLVDSVADLHAIGEGSFSERAIRSSNALVDGDINVYTEIDPAAGHLILVPDRGGAELAAVQEDFMRLQDQHPAIKRQSEDDEANVHVISKLCTRKEWQSLEIYHEVFKKMGLNDQAVVSAPVGAPRVLGVTISRTRRGFRADEIQALRLYAGHFTQAYRLQQSLLDQEALLAEGTSASLGRRGVILSDGTGTVVHATGDATRLLARYFPTARRVPGELPPVVRGRLLQLASTSEVRLEASSVLQQFGGDAKLRIEFLRLRHFDRWRLQLTEVDRSHAQRMQAQGLPPRLKSVLELLLTDLSEKQVAAQLGLTRATTHGYVKDVFRAVGVHSRSELMALWVQR